LLAAFLIANAVGQAQEQQQQPTARPPDASKNEPRLKLREKPPTSGPRIEQVNGRDVWILPEGTRLPIALRQPLSTKSANPGDPVYAQTTFPILVDNFMAIPAGTWVQGTVDTVKRAGRIKGTAEMRFHLTKLIYPNGYNLDIAAAIDQVPGGQNASVKEPGTVKQDPEKGKDLERIGSASAQAGMIGSLAGAAAGGSFHSFGVGGLAGVAAGTLIGVLTRGTDVTFDTGSAVEIVLGRAMAIEPEKTR
jgi:type IV secretion system protein VirB10